MGPAQNESWHIFIKHKLGNVTVVPSVKRSIAELSLFELSVHNLYISILVYEYDKIRGDEEWYGELKEGEKKRRNSMVDFVTK